MTRQSKNQKANKEEKAMQNNEEILNKEEQAMQENTINENIISENVEKENTTPANEQEQATEIEKENEGAQAGENANEEQAAQENNEEQAPANEGEKEKRAPLFTENLLLSCWAICDNEEFKQKPVEKQRAIAQSVIDKNNVLLRNYDTLLEHYRTHAPRSYERALWTVHVLTPNRERVLKEINNARNFILNTYSKLPFGDIEKVEKALQEISDSWEYSIVNAQFINSKKALTEYIVIDSEYHTERVVKFFVNASISGFVIASDISKNTRQLLKENNYKYVDDYEKPAENVEGLGEIPSVEGMLYIKK